MKLKTIFFLTFMSLLLISVNAWAREIVLIGDDSYPPYSYYENGQAKGIYIEVIKKAFEEIEGYEVRFEMMPWKRCINNVKKGKYIGFFPPYHSNERESWTEFSEPILQEQVVVFGNPEKLKGKTKWPEDFYGTVIGLNDGFSPASMAGEEFATAVEQGKITIDEGKNNEINLKKLAAGRVDFYINDKFIDTSAFPSIKRGIVAKTNWGYLGFTREKSRFQPYFNEFKNKFNNAVKDLKTSGKIDKILAPYAK